MTAAILALGAIGGASASASAKLVLTTAKGPLVPGQDVVWTGFSAWVTAGGDVDCIHNALSGELTVNSAGKDKGLVSSATSTGTQRGPEGEETLCENHTLFGAARVTWSGLPFAAEYTTKGAAVLKGTKKIVMTQEFPYTEETKCVYETAKVSSTFKVGGPMEPSTSQVFSVNTKVSNAGCPRSGTWEANWTVFSNGELVESELQ